VGHGRMMTGAGPAGVKLSAIGRMMTAVARQVETGVDSFLLFFSFGEATHPPAYTHAHTPHAHTCAHTGVDVGHTRAIVRFSTTALAR
jgi:hypothetical protein